MRTGSNGERGAYFIVAPAGAARAVVYDMSEEAYQDGVRKGMPLGRARRLSRNARLISPSFDRYQRAMKDLIRRTRAYSPKVEGGSADGICSWMPLEPAGCSGRRWMWPGG